MSQPETIRAITMLSAAGDLKISRCRLFKLLQAHGHFVGNLPTTALIQAGYFRVEIHQWRNRNNERIARQYGIAMVTSTGLAWLREFLNGVGYQPPAEAPRRRNLREPAQPVAGTDQGQGATGMARAG